MRTKSIHSIPILLVIAAMLGGCAGEKPAGVTERSGDPQSPAALKDALTSYNFERRSEFTSQFNAMYSEFTAQLREYEAKNPPANATGETKAAVAEVKSAETDFKSKLDALATADAGSWNTARDNVVASWERLQAAFGRVHATNVIPSQGL
jgi:hypothetical protein